MKCPECPVCGNDRESLTNKLGEWQCGACKHIWNPNAPKPAPVDPAVQAILDTPVGMPIRTNRPRENAAQQIRAIHAGLKERLPEADDSVLRELALDLHQILSDAAALGSVQAGLDALGVR